MRCSEQLVPPTLTLCTYTLVVLEENSIPYFPSSFKFLYKSLKRRKQHKKSDEFFSFFLYCWCFLTPWAAAIERLIFLCSASRRCIHTNTSESPAMVIIYLWENEPTPLRVSELVGGKAVNVYTYTRYIYMQHIERCAAHRWKKKARQPKKIIFIQRKSKEHFFFQFRLVPANRKESVGKKNKSQSRTFYTLAITFDIHFVKDVTWSPPSPLHLDSSAQPCFFFHWGF